MKRVDFTDRNNLVIQNKQYADTLLYFNRCNRPIIKDCLFERSCIVLLNCINPLIQYNDFINSASKHAIIFNTCSRGAIKNNYFKEPIGSSPMEDIINLYKSNGTRESPILVAYNYLIGGGPSLSGGGILLGDNMGDWQVAKGNICITCGQYGIAIAGGNNNKIIENTVMSKQRPWTNVGIYVWGVPQRSSTVSNALVEGNKVNWTKRNGVYNPWWLGANTSNVIQRNNNFRAPYVEPAKPSSAGGR